MEESVRRALEQDRTIDITTTGSLSGLPRRKEIWFHNLDGDLYITGMPGHRHWYSNMLANPKLIFHLKRNAQADIPARATPVLDLAERRKILSAIHPKMGGQRDLEAWVEGSPLVKIELLVE